MTAHTVSAGLTTPVHSAVLLMRTHSLYAMAVLDDGQVTGVVDAATLFMYQPDIMVRDIMGPAVSVDAEATLSTAASLMRAHGLAELPVMDGDICGSVKAIDLLNAWAMPVDPLTGLPWQDSFRLRSSTELASGKELTLLFFDLDDFGALNKTHGHIVGDRALKAVAHAIRIALDTRYDIGCRFGGDEFVVSTTRARTEAIEWATEIQREIQSLEVEGLDATVGVSIGIAGGLRHGERPGTHGPATLDDLINRASQASTVAKATVSHMMSLDSEAHHIAPPPKEPVYPPRAARVRIRGVQTDIEGSRLRASVRLELKGIPYNGTHDGSAGVVHSTIAEATANALTGLLPPSYAIRLSSVNLHTLDDSSCVVMAVVRMDSPYGRQSLVGVADATSDPHHAVVKAVLDAVNRPLEAITLQPAPEVAAAAAN